MQRDVNGVVRHRQGIHSSNTLGVSHHTPMSQPLSTDEEKALLQFKRSNDGGVSYDDFSEDVWAIPIGNYLHIKPKNKT